MTKKLICFSLVMCFTHLLVAQKDGKFEDFFEDGQLKTSGQYKNKKRIGEWKSYYKTGELLSVYSYSKGKKNKVYKVFYKDGSLKRETKKIDGVFVNKGFYESGNLFFERLLKNGYYKEYYDSDVLKVESNYIDNQLNGIWKLFYPTGELEWQVAYKEGYKEGSYKQFYKNDILKVEGFTKKNKKEGIEKRYLEDGSLEWEGAYKNDVFNKTWNHFDASGNKIESIKYKKGLPLTINNSKLSITKIPNGLIETVPIYPGCEKELNNKGRKKCMSSKIAQFVMEKFNTDMAANLGLTGKQKIYIIFKISKSGKVIDVLPKAKNASLKYEAFRVISLLPDMKPGIQRGKAVVVPYSLPIIFQVQDKKKSNASKYGFKSRN